MRFSGTNIPDEKRANTLLLLLLLLCYSFSLLLQHNVHHFVKMEMTMYLQVECMCSINKTEKSGNVCDLLLRWRRKGKRNLKARTERRNE
jgi:hypothetical protein